MSFASGTTQRNRMYYSLTVGAIIMLGLASRRFPILPAFLGKYPGDALWALMVFVAWGAVFPKTSTARITFLTLATSYAIEFLKLYQSSWLDGIRHTSFGHLVFGYTFSLANLVAYTVGAAVGFGLERFYRRTTAKTAEPRQLR